MSSIIDELIFDRTNQDLINDTNKAYIDYNDLNRIEQACSYLADIFNVSISTKTWKISDFRTNADMERMRNNINKLKASYYSVPGMTIVPNKIEFTTIKQANDIEKILYELDNLYRSVQSGLKHLSFILGRSSIGNRR